MPPIIKLIAFILLIHGGLAVAQNKTASLPVDEIDALTRAFRHIKQLYVEDVSDKTLLRGAIKGMMDTLDTHSTFLDEDALDMMFRNTSGSYGGLGIEVDIKGEELFIVAPIDGGPAHLAGIQAGDKIIQIDDIKVEALPVIEAVELLKGELGTIVALMIERKGLPSAIKIEVERQMVEVKSVKSFALDPAIGYIKLSQFSSDTTSELKNALKTLKSRPQGLKGLIIDLRNNPGGVLQSAVEVSDMFLESGLIVETKDKVAQNEKYFANTGDILSRLPMVLLVNAGSASASEIVASALQHHRRAIIVGEKTYGKGSVQSIKMISQNTAIKLTTALYYAPDGRSIHGVGLEPSIAVTQEKQGDIFSPGTYLTNTKFDVNDILSKDIQLRTALNVVKGSHVSIQTKTTKH